MLQKTDAEAAVGMFSYTMIRVFQTHAFVSMRACIPAPAGMCKMKESVYASITVYPSIVCSGR